MVSGPQPLRPVDAVNRMTARWIQGCGDESSVFCAPSAWPLLALLAHAAEGSGRRELANAVGLPADDSRAAGVEVMALLRGMTAVRSALGVWASERLPLEPAWTAGLPSETVGSITGNPGVDMPALDDWARYNTGGLIDRMPLETDPSTLLLLTAAMSVRTRWLQPFTDYGRPATYDAGPWRGRRYHGLSRETEALDQVTVTATNQGEITCLRLPGDQDIIVHLVIGETERPAADVLKGGLAALSGRDRRGGELRIGDTAPGLFVEWTTDFTSADRLRALVPRFRVGASHDLLRQPDVFGLQTVTDTTRGHFPVMSRYPLAVSAAKQNAVAHFTAKGFEAAAVTVFGFAAAGMPTQKAKQVSVTFDRPFGFYAVHHPSGLILAAGWVAEPESA